MNAEEAYKINLAAEIYANEGKIFFTQRWIEDGKYRSHIMELEEKIKHSGAVCYISWSFRRQLQ